MSGVALRGPDAEYHFHVKMQADMLDVGRWPEAIQWLKNTVKRYEAAVGF
jgi:hypothetical protein